jgi:pyridoxal phosphate enzyme (YggS family)
LHPFPAPRRHDRAFYDEELALEVSTIEARLHAVESRIQSALQRARRQRSEITLVAVSKKFSAERIREAYQAGLREFGENYVQEFAEKRPQLQDVPEARFHLIGHLQTNKARPAVELFDVIETADSPKLLQRLDAAAAAAQRRSEVLLEIKLSQEASKSGASPDDIPRLLQAAAACSHLQLSGLMTMPPWSDDAELSRPYFKRLAALALRHKLPKLSMGMSHDFEVAIEEGATIIRVGTALFGARPKPQRDQPALPA